MMGQTATYLLVVWLTAAASSVCFAQGNAPQNDALNKKACDYLTKSEAEAILGTSVESQTDNATACVFVNVGGLQAGKKKQVRLIVYLSTSPDANGLAAAKKGIALYPVASMGVKDVPDFGDAAMWLWVPGSGGTFWAFKGGTIQVEVTIAGIAEDATLQNAKALAAKPLGGTGYAHLGTPKSNAQKLRQRQS
jgi:hypothetical protein